MVGFESDAEYLGGFEQSLLRRLLAVPAAANLGKELLQMVVVELPHTTERPLTRRRRPRR